jgi:hypothetical protein
MDRKIKGEYLVDYVRMIKRRKDIDWSEYLTVDDLLFLKKRIVGNEWYPMEPFERIATAIFKKVADGNVEVVRLWGRMQAEEVARTYDSLVSKGNPHDSLIQFQVLRKTFFNFDPIDVIELFRNYAKLAMNFRMNPAAEQAATYQSLGILERLVELSGASNIKFSFPSKLWEGGKSTVLELDWSNAGPEMKVKGGLFVDYVKMLKKKKGVDWSKYLLPRDLKFLEEQILPSEWYPYESFERMGIAVLHEVASGNMEVVLAFGQITLDEMARAFSNLVSKGDPRESLMRFEVLRNSFFNFNAVTIESISAYYAKLRIEYSMSREAEEAASFQAAGFFIQLLRLSGAKEIEYRFAGKSWAGDPSTILELKWKEVES